ncbi:MAG: PQQ-binding-like beta-propeller repeat protein, partial [Planctomycetes bacterium]|nr:PQQ-binding-like beta-propeller repeat protein [Planctomycetota bacterium]
MDVKRGFRIALVAVALAVAVIAAPPASAQAPTPAAGAAGTGAQSEETAADTVVSPLRSVVVCPPPPEIDDAWREGNRLADTGEAREAARRFQSVLDRLAMGGADYAVASGDGLHRSLADLCRARLARLPADATVSVREELDGAVDRALALADPEQRWAALSRLATTHWIATHGARLLAELCELAVERGDLPTAARSGERLLRDLPPGDPAAAATALWTAFALAALNLVEAATELRAALPPALLDQPVSVDGKDLPLREAWDAQAGAVASRAGPAGAPYEAALPRWSARTGYGDPADDVETWSRDEHAPPPLSASAATDGATVFVGRGGSLLALDAATGRERWRYPHFRPRPSAPDQGRHDRAPTIAGGVVAASVGGDLAAFDTLTGRMLWVRAGVEFAARVGAGSPEARIAALSAPTAAGDAVYVVTAIRVDDLRYHVHALSLANGRFRWSRQVAAGPCSSYLGFAPAPAAPVVSRGDVVVQTNVGVLACLGAGDGRFLWARRYDALSGGALRALAEAGRDTGWPSAPAVTAGAVFATPADSDAVLAIDRLRGRLLWSASASGARRLLGLSAGMVVLCGESLQARAAATGQLRWGRPLEAASPSPAAALIGGRVALLEGRWLRMVEAADGGEAGRFHRAGPVEALETLAVAGGDLFAVSRVAVERLASFTADADRSAPLSHRVAARAGRGDFAGAAAMLDSISPAESAAAPAGGLRAVVHRARAARAEVEGQPGKAVAALEEAIAAAPPGEPLFPMYRDFWRLAWSADDRAALERCGRELDGRYPTEPLPLVASGAELTLPARAVARAAARRGLIRLEPTPGAPVTPAEAAALEFLPPAPPEAGDARPAQSPAPVVAALDPAAAARAARAVAEMGRAREAFRFLDRFLAPRATERGPAALSSPEAAALRELWEGAAQAARPRVVARRMTRAPLMDGVLDDAWAAVGSVSRRSLAHMAPLLRPAAAAPGLPPTNVADPGATWGGPYDLSARFFFGWDDECLYLAVEVSDEEHIPFDFEHVDCFGDILFTSIHSLVQGKEVHVAPAGGHVFGHQRPPPGGKKDDEKRRKERQAMRDRMAVRRDRERQVTVYELAFPWSAFFYPERGGRAASAPSPAPGANPAPTTDGEEGAPGPMP